MNADYWEGRTVLIRDGAVRMLSLSGVEEVAYWRDELKSNRRNSREIELMTWAKNAVTLQGRVNYGRKLRNHRKSFDFRHIGYSCPILVTIQSCNLVRVQNLLHGEHYIDALHLSG